MFPVGKRMSFHQMLASQPAQATKYRRGNPLKPDGTFSKADYELASLETKLPKMDKDVFCKSQDSTMEALRKKLAAVSLEFRNIQRDANDCLPSTREELEDTQAQLKETQPEFQNAQDARANSERARQAASL
ncbi:hypothetical protein BGX28_008280 [Mortierella sp. GBA30]|nr:hypothetical protein BGX28_008280 [Mortierella sp. GBA30]